jgi:excisionase family DNA binding protein
MSQNDSPNPAQRRPARDLQRIPVISTLLGCSDRTVRNLIARGELTAYKLPGFRGILIDRNEVLASMRTVPATRPERRAPSYGPNARIVNLPARAIVVPTDGDES